MNCRAFWNIWAHGPWYDIAAEQIVVLARAKIQFPVEAHIHGATRENAADLRQLAAGMLSNFEAHHHPENSFEYHGLAALKKWCDGNPDGSACYFHTKNASLVNGPRGAKWRWAMMFPTLCEWPLRIEDLKIHDAVGVAYMEHHSLGRIFAGNFWWARADWIAKLPEPQRQPPSRWHYESWLLSRPGARIKNLVTDGQALPGPHQDEFYTKYQDAHFKVFRWLSEAVTSPHSPIIIAGMHRSGTSAVASALQACGLWLGPTEKLIPANEHNELGHFEHIDFVALNDSLLQEQGTTWLEPPSRFKIATTIQGAQGDTLVADLARGGKPFGWKDPRNTITLPYWLKVAPNLRVIHCSRSRDEIVASLNKRDGLTTVQGIELCQRYERLAAENMQGVPICRIDYSELIEKPERTIRTMCDFAGLYFSEKALAMIRPDLRHHHTT
jgi:hypothetical protein